jgi:hypothetical protein
VPVPRPFVVRRIGGSPLRLGLRRPPLLAGDLLANALGLAKSPVWLEPIPTTFAFLYKHMPHLQLKAGWKRCELPRISGRKDRTARSAVGEFW